MTIRTSPTLPDDYGPTTARHDRSADMMRETTQWVYVGTYKTRKTAAHIASDARNGRIKAYRGGVYDMRPITTRDGEHQVWGRYLGGAR